MKYLGFLVILLLNSLFVVGQVASQKDKITLNSGEVYVGEILVQNNELIMLKTKDGTRYQFQLAEINKVEKELVQVSSTAEPTEISRSTANFSGIFELSGGISSAKNCIDTSPEAQLALIFGNKNAFQKNLFLGLGMGIDKIFVFSNSTSIGFLPLFLRLQTTLNKNRTTPFVGMDAGYAFALNQGFGGGTMVKITAGISHRINYKTFLIAGVYAGANAISGNLTETNDLGTFRYYGNTSINSLGVKIGLQF
jgi:hypothetical protein